MKRFYREVAQIYELVDGQLPKIDGNPCGECHSCCTSEYMKHTVSQLELDTLESHIGKARTERFKRYLAHEKTELGGFTFPRCPLHDGHQCTVHRFRPLSCRLYGHFRSSKTELIEHCVFKGQETVVPQERERQLLPGSGRLTRLSLEYHSYADPGEYAAVESGQGGPTSSELERAIALFEEQRLEEAQELLERLCQTDQTVAARQTLGHVYQMLKQYDKAAETFRLALELTCDNPQLYYELGTALFLGNRPQEAETAFIKSLALAPSRPMTLGLLGMTHNALGQTELATARLRAAIDLETEPGPFRLQLATVYEQEGDLDTAREWYVAALEHGFSVEQARESLERLVSREQK